MAEEWLSIVGFPGYEVGSLGNVRSWWVPRSGVKKLKEPRVLKSFFDGSGYLRVKLYKNKKPKTLSVHRLVACAFMRASKERNTVNHINGIKTDNRVENLEWVTFQENIDHSYKTGLANAPYGSRSSFAILNETQAIEIFYDDRPRKAIAQKYGVSVDCVRKIKLKQNWGHLWK